MDLGASRAQWDLTFESGEIIEHVAGRNSDVVRITLREQFGNGASGGSQDVYLQRAWSFDADGSFSIALASVDASHLGGKKSVRKVFGGWIVTPFSSSSNPPDQPGSSEGEWTSACLVTNAVKITNGGWLEWIKNKTNASANDLPVRVVLAQVAGLRELCEHTSDLELSGHGAPLDHTSAGRRKSMGDGDDDDFFEASSEASEDDCAFPDVNGASTSNGQKTNSAHVDDLNNLGSLAEGRWPADQNRKSRNCWCSPDGNMFRVRDVNYLRDRKKRLAGKPFADLIAVDWFVDKKRIDNLCARPSGTCMTKILSGENGETSDRFVFCINIQVPGAKYFSIVYYFLLNEPLDPESTFGKFVAGDQTYKDVRLKLIPHVALGPWVVQRAVGTKPLIVGKALKVRYHSERTQRGAFLECDIDIGSSAVANNVVRFVLGYVKTLVVDMCFLVEGKTEKDLPERLIGTSRVAHLEPESAVAPPPEE